MKWLGMEWKGALGAGIAVAAIGLMGLGLTGAACSSSTHEAGAEAEDGSVPEAEVAPPKDGDVKRLLKRSSQRVELVCKGDWIQVYDFYSKTYKEVTSLYNFIQGKDIHHYKDPSSPLWVGYKDGKGYLEVDLFWKTTHPQVLEQNKEGTPWEILEMIEVWEWDGSRWSYRENERRSEFYQVHPDLLK